MRCLGTGAASPAPTRRREEEGREGPPSPACSHPGVPQSIDRADDDRCHSSPGDPATRHHLELTYKLLDGHGHKGGTQGMWCGLLTSRLHWPFVWGGGNKMLYLQITHHARALLHTLSDPVPPSCRGICRPLLILTVAPGSLLVRDGRFNCPWSPSAWPARPQSGQFTPC